MHTANAWWVLRRLAVGRCEYAYAAMHTRVLPPVLHAACAATGGDMTLCHTLVERQLICCFETWGPGCFCKTGVCKLLRLSRVACF